jgi:hypothetical protein
MGLASGRGEVLAAIQKIEGARVHLVIFSKTKFTTLEVIILSEAMSISEVNFKTPCKK